MNLFKFTFFLIFPASIIFSQNVKVSDYDVPVSTAKVLRLNGTYNWSQTSNDTATIVGANDASATLLFRSFYSSLPFAWFFDVDATGGRSFGNWTHDISIRPSIRKYVWENRDWFGFASFDARHANTFRQLEANLQSGAGYGRYINATALAKAVRIEEHLIREGVLKGNLPKETMIRIANIIEREAEYRGIYGETYEKNWYEDIEKEMRNSDLLTGNALGAMGILRTQQVLKSIGERVNERYYGWDVTAGILFNLSKRDKSTVNSPALAAGGRFSYPIGWSSQVDAFANVNTPLDSAFFKRVVTAAGVNFLYELSNKINFVAGYNLNHFTQSGINSYLDHRLTASFIFYLENQINLGINTSMVRSGFTKVTDLRSNISLQYNFF